LHKQLLFGAAVILSTLPQPLPVSAAILPIRVDNLDGKPFYNGVSCLGVVETTGDIIPEPVDNNVITKISYLLNSKGKILGALYYGTRGMALATPQSLIPFTVLPPSVHERSCADGFATPKSYRNQASRIRQGVDQPRIKYRSSFVNVFVESAQNSSALASPTARRRAVNRASGRSSCAGIASCKRSAADS